MTGGSTACPCGVLTRVHSNAQLKSGVWHVTDLEVAHGRQKVEAHCGYLSSVVVPIANRQPGHHHVWSA